MKLKDTLSYQWEYEEEWNEKWYDQELEFSVFKNNPLFDIFNQIELRIVALNTHWYYIQEDIDQWVKRKEAAVRDKNILEQVVKQSQVYIDEVKGIIWRIEKINIIDSQWLQEIKKGLILSWCIFAADLGESLSSHIYSKFKEKGFSHDQIEDTVDYCFNFKHPYGFQQEEADLQKIKNIYMRKYKNADISFKDIDKELKSLLRKHTEKYSYLTGIDLDTEPYTTKDFFEKMRRGQSAQQRLGPKELPPSLKRVLKREDIYYLHLVHRHIFIDNYTADLYAKLEYIMRKKLTRKFSISSKSLTWYTFTELERLVKTNQKLSPEEIKVRKKYRVMILYNGEIKILYGKDNFESIKNRLQTKTHRINIKFIKGLIASRGQVRGRVQIVKRIEDMEKVKKGDILVAPTTRPDLLLALRRCVAIITDSGGITSHAAIISREFGIPCIVGTDIATRVLKDGDMVEVDANKGIVTIIGSS